MLKISDKKFFLEIVADAVIQAHQTCRTKKTRNRWINAVAKAAAVILEGDCAFSSLGPREKFSALLVGGFKRNL